VSERQYSTGASRLRDPLEPEFGGALFAKFRKKDHSLLSVIDADTAVICRVGVKNAVQAPPRAVAQRPALLDIWVGAYVTAVECRV
jgi:hypothetical protein